MSNYEYREKDPVTQIKVLKEKAMPYMCVLFIPEVGALNADQ
jgi:hypothetical protein